MHITQLFMPQWRCERFILKIFHFLSIIYGCTTGGIDGFVVCDLKFMAIRIILNLKKV